MSKKNLSKDNSIHVTDERINTITSMIATVFAILGGALLIVESSVHSNIWHIVAFGIYSLGLISLFLFSALHHGIDGSEKLNNILRTFDYLSIFVLIAGTVTPLVLVLERNIFGWTVLGVTWGISIFGIILRTLIPNIPKHIINTLFILLGWLPVVLIFGGLKLTIGGLILLVIGGLFYSIGFIIYVREEPNPKPGFFGFHEIWHLCVIGGAFCHYLLMYIYVLPHS